MVWVSRVLPEWAFCIHSGHVITKLGCLPQELPLMMLARCPLQAVVPARVDVFSGQLPYNIAAHSQFNQVYSRPVCHSQMVYPERPIDISAAFGSKLWHGGYVPVAHLAVAHVKQQQHTIIIE